jgi:hypothetical protein
MCKTIFGQFNTGEVEVEPGDKERFSDPFVAGRVSFSNSTHQYQAKGNSV